MGQGLLKQYINPNPAGVPGTTNAYIGKKTITMSTTAANTVITDVGLLYVAGTAASVSVQIQDPSTTWTDVIAASTTPFVLIPSDGANFRAHSADTSTARTLTYYIIQ